MPLVVAIPDTTFPISDALKLKLLVNPSRSEKLCTAGSEGL